MKQASRHRNIFYNNQNDTIVVERGDLGCGHAASIELRLPRALRGALPAARDGDRACARRRPEPDAGLAPPVGRAFAKHAAARAGLISDRRDAPATQFDLLRLLEQRNIVCDKIAECFHCCGGQQRRGA